MKKLLITIGAVALLSFSAKAQAPSYSPSTTTFVATNALTSATNVGWVIDVSHQASVGVSVSLTCDGTNATTVGAWVTRSINGTTYDNAGQFLQFQCNGTTTYTTVTNLQSYGAQNIKFNYLTNGNGTVNVTNATMRYGVKISSP